MKIEEKMSSEENGKDLTASVAVPAIRLAAITWGKYSSLILDDSDGDEDGGGHGDGDGGDEHHGGGATTRLAATSY